MATMQAPDRVRVGVVALVALVGLSSCGGSSRSGSEDSVSAAPQPEIRVCTDIPYDPFEYESGGQPTGFDVELVTTVANRMGRTATFVTTPLDQFAPALASGFCELVASALPITTVPAGSLAFSDPYLDVGQATLVRASDAERFPTFDSLAGATVGAVADSPSADFARSTLPPGTMTTTFATIDDAVAALQAGRLEAVVIDAPVAGHLALHDDTLRVTEARPTDTRYGLATSASGTTLLAEVNNALAELRSDGTLHSLSVRWFGS
jgi:polar amino acid transport system substrate-binding protein